MEWEKPEAYGGSMEERKGRRWVKGVGGFNGGRCGGGVQKDGFKNPKN